jgi:aspartate aminotransferase
MPISRLARDVGESPTLKLNQRAGELRASGAAVIHLGAGEPKSKVPMEAILAASGLLGSGEIRYTATDGTPGMKKAIIKYMADNYRVEVGPKNVIVSAGAKQALYTLLLAIVDPGDEVVFPAPYWVSYPEMIRLCGGIPRPVSASDGGFVPSLADVESALGPKTRAVILNSPNNPSGAVYSDTLVSGVVELCERLGLYCVLDDIYHRLVFDGRDPPNACRFAKQPFPASRLVVINGVSKLYAMTGFRIGWTVTNPEVQAAMDRIQAQTTSCPSALLQEAAAAAIQGDQGCVDTLRLTLQNHRDVMCRELAGIRGVRVQTPAGTFYCLPDFRAYSGDSDALSRMLLDKAQVVTVPGREFGMEGFLRLSFCGSLKDAVDGVARIRWALDPESPREIFIGDRRCVRDWT